MDWMDIPVWCLGWWRWFSISEFVFLFFLCTWSLDFSGACSCSGSSPKTYGVPVFLGSPTREFVIRQIFNFSFVTSTFLVSWFRRFLWIWPGWGRDAQNGWKWVEICYTLLIFDSIFVPFGNFTIRGDNNCLAPAASFLSGSFRHR